MQYLLDRLSGDLGLHKHFTVSHSAFQVLLQHSWPGNIRELKNVLSQAIVSCNGDTIEPGHLPLSATTQPVGQELSSIGASEFSFISYRESMDAHSRKLIEDALKRAGWNRTKAAAMLGLQRTYLTKLLRKLKISGKPETQ